MTFCIITHVAHGQDENGYYAYSPYVREINIWIKHVDKVVLVAPLTLEKQMAIDIKYHHQNIFFTNVPEFNFLNLKALLKTICLLPSISLKIYKAMKEADHIHLRCPGNMGMLGCMLQILFPGKTKTAKYAGNWDFKSKQPLSYRMQKWILSNTFLTKNMQVLVYGEWEKSSKNIKPFFTASYFEKDKTTLQPRTLKGNISFLFVGTLSNGKQPIYAIKLLEQLKIKGYNVQLTLYGEGNEREMLMTYIFQKKLENFIFLAGNQNQEMIKKAFMENHFVVLPSLSEGWPKVVAEGMFWGCLPIASKVSCVPNMLEDGGRGVLLSMDLATDVKQLELLLHNNDLYQEKVKKAADWSRNYTLDIFENEIKKLLIS